MADSEPFLFECRPGIRRDGTELDSSAYREGVWVRFQRQRPRKIGGYRSMSRLANGPVRAVFLDSRNDANSAHYFSRWGIQRQEFSDSGAGGALVDRTPLSFVAGDYTWTASAMYSGSGSPYSALICAATPDLNDISDSTNGYVYAGDLSGTGLLTRVEDGSGPIEVSGGVCVLQPYLFVYGENGLIRNSNANDFSTATGWTTGGANDANTANVAGTKIVYGAPTRGGGQSPAGLFWALDALIRVTYTGDDRIWAYDTLTTISILAKRSVVEVDGKFFWPGLGRFMFYNGAVQELPNDMNLNWFFDNVNPAAMNKVWGTRIARWGEIWWFFPFGSSTECNAAVIYNYRENIWYDAVCERAAGDSSNTFRFPIWVGEEDARDTLLLTTGVKLETSATTASANGTLHFASAAAVANGMLVNTDNVPAGTTVASTTATTAVLSAVTTGVIPVGQLVLFQTMSTAFTLGETVTGGTSGDTGVVARVQETTLNLIDYTGDFTPAESLSGSSGGAATLLSAAEEQQLDTIYLHESGTDKVLDSDVSAIPSSVTSADFGLAVGGPFARVPKALNRATRLVRLEPDFAAVGDLTLTIEGREYASKSMETIETLNIVEGAPFVDPRAQARMLRVKISSNVVGGTYQFGQPIMHLGPGDERSKEPT